MWGFGEAELRRVSMNESARMERHERRNASLREPPGVEKPLASSGTMWQEPKRGRGSGAGRDW